MVHLPFNSIIVTYCAFLPFTSLLPFIVAVVPFTTEVANKKKTSRMKMQRKWHWNNRGPTRTHKNTSCHIRRNFSPATRAPDL